MAMIATRILQLMTAALFSSILVICLFVWSDSEENLKYGFSRIFPEHPNLGDPLNSLNLGYSGYYFSGIADGEIYLSYSQAPAHILKLSPDLTDTVHVALEVNLSPQKKINLESIKTFVDPPSVYFSDGTTGSVVQAFFKKDTSYHYTLEHSFFTSFIPYSDQSYFIRNYDPDIQQNVLERRNPVNTHNRSFRYVPEKQVDGIFCTDGMLLFSKDLSMLVYLYYYRNQFVVLDPDMQVVYEGRTIDTTSQAQIKISSSKGGTQQTISEPPLVVNRKSSVSNGKLYVNSGLMSENENFTDFKKNSVIDIYDLLSRKYLFSFYIPNFQDKKLSDFEVIGELLIAQYDEHLFSYQLDFPD